MVEFYGEGDRIGKSSDYEAVTVEPSGTSKVTVLGNYGVANPKYITKAYQDSLHIPETIIHTNNPSASGTSPELVVEEEEGV